MINRLLGILLLMVLSGPARADTIQIGFDYVFDTGLLAGQTGQGTIRVDEPLGVWTTPNTGFKEFHIAVEGNEFAIQDDKNYPSFPAILTESDPPTVSSIVSHLDYLAEDIPFAAGSADIAIFFSWNPDLEEIVANTINYIDPNGIGSYGYITAFYTSLNSAIVSIDDFVYRLPKPPKGVNKALAARAKKYGVSISELFSAPVRSTRKTNGNRTKSQ